MVCTAGPHLSLCRQDRATQQMPHNLRRKPEGFLGIHRITVEMNWVWGSKGTGFPGATPKSPADGWSHNALGSGMGVSVNNGCLQGWKQAEKGNCGCQFYWVFEIQNMAVFRATLLCSVVLPKTEKVKLSQSQTNQTILDYVCVPPVRHQKIPTVFLASSLPARHCLSCAMCPSEDRDQYR